MTARCAAATRKHVRLIGLPVNALARQIGPKPAALEILDTISLYRATEEGASDIISRRTDDETAYRRHNASPSQDGQPAVGSSGTGDVRWGAIVSRISFKNIW